MIPAREIFDFSNPLIARLHAGHAPHRHGTIAVILRKGYVWGAKMYPPPSSIPSAQSRIRWLKSELSRDQLHGKKVFAEFSTHEGTHYRGSGEIRALSNGELLAVDLVFTRSDGNGHYTDIITHLSSRQLARLQPASPGEAYDYRYEGVLQPDNDPDHPEYFDLLDKQALFFGVLSILKARTQYFSYKTIQETAQEAGLSIKDTSLRVYLVEAVAKGLIHSAGRGWYSGLSEAFTLNPSSVASLVHTLQTEFPLLKFSCWSTEQIQAHGHNLLTKFVSFVHTDRDAMESVGERLRDVGYTVFINPRNEAAKNFSIRDPRTVIIRPLITNQPHEQHLVSIEGILVELFLESQILNLMDLGEFYRILDNVTTRYRLKLALLLDFALERRPIGKELVEYINAEYSRKSALVNPKPSS